MRRNVCQGNYMESPIILAEEVFKKDPNYAVRLAKAILNLDITFEMAGSEETI